MFTGVSDAQALLLLGVFNVLWPQQYTFDFSCEREELLVIARDEIAFRSHYKQEVHQPMIDV